MSLDDGNGRFIAGQQSAQIETMAATLVRIEDKLDGLGRWQRDVDARLAAASWMKFPSMRLGDASLMEFKTDANAVASVSWILWGRRQY